MADDDQQTRTRATLLQQAAEGNEVAWARLDRLYRPMLMQWARQLGASDRDADEAASDVLIVLVTFLKKFNYDPQRSFRAYLRTMLRNEIRRMYRQQMPPTDDGSWLNQLATDSAEDSLVELLIAEEERLQIPAILLIARQRCRQTTTWLSWERTELYEETAASVAAQLNISVASVYVNRQRVAELIAKVGREIQSENTNL